MADRAPKLSRQKLTKITKLNQNISATIDQLNDQLQAEIYGAVPSTDIASLDAEFEKLVNNEIKNMTDHTNGDPSSFLEKLFNDGLTRDNQYVSNIEQIFRQNQTRAQSLLSEAYRNKLVKRADIQEVTSQLNELREAILVTRDAIVSSDVVDGHMSRTLSIHNTNENESINYQSIIEKMEEHFKLQSRIKNYIIPKTLEQGEYYAYVIPYSKVFEDFMKIKKQGKYADTPNFARESAQTVMESAMSDYMTEANSNEVLARKKVADELFKALPKSVVSESGDTAKVKDALGSILENISVSNDSVPLAILEEGALSCDILAQYMTEADDVKMPSLKNAKKSSFEFINDIDTSGIHKSSTDKDDENEFKFDDTKECYFKLIDSMHIIPIRIMSKTIGYYYVQEDILNVASDSNYFLGYNGEREQSVVSMIASKIVKAFDKKFLEDNQNFKELIVEAIEYFNLNERKIRFQYIPAEYIVPFKINEDENGNGTSVVEPALFYAKLYLLLLLFKMVSIVSSSNDTKVHYIRNSGIDKNVANAIQAIARKMQSRQINLTDMFSYTTLVNKVGNGNDLFIPLGRGDNKGIETEILAGQDVQLNTELMELLRNGYISATGVPAVILNNINEADFAKTLELGNTRFQSRVVSLQLDFGDGITEMYRRLLKWTTTLPEAAINNFHFEFQPPKYSQNQVKNDLLSSFQTELDFAASINFNQAEIEDSVNGGSSPLMREFKALYAEEKLPMMNIKRIRELGNEARIRSKSVELKDSASEEGEEGAGGGGNEGNDQPPPPPQ